MEGLSKYTDASCVGEMKRKRNCVGQACSDRVNEYTGGRVGENKRQAMCARIGEGLSTLPNPRRGPGVGREHSSVGVIFFFFITKAMRLNVYFLPSSFSRSMEIIYRRPLRVIKLTIPLPVK